MMNYIIVSAIVITMSTVFYLTGKETDEESVCTCPAEELTNGIGQLTITMIKAIVNGVKALFHYYDSMMSEIQKIEA